MDALLNRASYDIDCTQAVVFDKVLAEKDIVGTRLLLARHAPLVAVHWYAYIVVISATAARRRLLKTKSDTIVT